MNQKTLIALGAMAVVAILAVVTMRAPQKGERVGPRQRPIAALKAEAVKELEITANNAKDKVAFKLDGGLWKMTAPAPQPADQSQLKTAIEQLEKTQFGDLVTEKKERFADLEVSEEKGAHVVARDGGGKVLLDAWIGKSVSGFTMVRPADKDQVWQATGIFKYTYAKDTKNWRDHTVLSFGRDDTDRLAVEAGAQKVVLEKLPPPADAAKDNDKAAATEAKWKVVESTVKVDPLDDAAVSSMVTALSSLSASDFDDSGNLADAGLAPPRARITITNKGTALTLLLGAVKGEDLSAQVEGRSQIYLLRKYAVDRVVQKPIDFRDKTVVKAKEADLVGLDVSTAGESYSLEKSGTASTEWKLTRGGKGAADDAKVRPLVTAFEDLKGSTFADPADAASFGLARPTGTATLHLRDKSTVVVKVGAATKDGTEYYVQRGGSPDVLQVKKFQADRFLKKAADLVKTDAAPAK